MEKEKTSFLRKLFGEESSIDNKYQKLPSIDENKKE